MEKHIKNQGFTIIEILAVIVVIGILATIAVVYYENYYSKAKDAKSIAFVHNSSVILLANSVNQTDYPYDKIYDGVNDTELDDILDILYNDGQEIPNNGYGYWYFSSDFDYIVATCSQEIKGKLITMGTSNSEKEIECPASTNYRIPRPKNGGWFDGGVNFKLSSI